MRETPQDFRSHERRSLRFVCACRLPGGLTTEAELSDISTKGTRARFFGVCALVGDRVEFMINGDEPIRGIVRRADEDVAGVEFDVAVSDYIIERLLFDNPARDA